MAKIKLGTLVTDIRGAVGGTIFSRNRGGAYAKKNTSPVQPNSSSQMSVRSIFGSVANTWKSLTGAQQNAWRLAAPSFTYTDIFGETREYSGQQLFMKLNSQLLLVDISATLQTTPPALASLDTINVAQVAATTSTLTVTINSGADLTSPQEVLVYASVGTSLGVLAESSAGPYRLIGSFSTTSGVADIFTAYNAIYGAPVSGTRIHIKTASWIPTTGQTMVGANGRGTVA